MYHVFTYNMPTATVRQLRRDFASKPLPRTRREKVIGVFSTRGGLVTAKHCCRALDVLHLANARISGARTVLSFDHRQRAAALDLGFAVAP